MPFATTDIASDSPSVIQNSNSVPLVCPTIVHNEEEARELFNEARRLEDACRSSKQESRRQLEAAFTTLKQAEMRLFEVQVHMGRIQYVISKCGFKIPTLNVACPMPAIQIHGSLHSVKLDGSDNLGVVLD
ncbi:hypothetical protein NLJ89_g1504 [Agrocybe chaxingu]|uniref:Uncharacterized protein n=1 Tax=Agrocybe chaxingu TaxID=84603 RepID=A0A9W8MZZ8_9AGAR|nr:hypothetical protein NLJ89_g1504 [Agrocybe chaxingu]